MRKTACVVLMPVFLVGALLLLVGAALAGLWTRASLTKAERKALYVKSAIDAALKAAVDAGQQPATQTMQRDTVIGEVEAK